MPKFVYFVPSKALDRNREIHIEYFSGSKRSANGYIFDVKKLRSKTGYIGRGASGTYWTSPAAYWRHKTRLAWYARFLEKLFSFIEA